MAIYTAASRRGGKDVNGAQSETTPGKGRPSKPRAARKSASTSPKSAREICIDAVTAAVAWLSSRAMLESHPWAGLTDLPRKVADGTFYTGTNCLLLWAVQDTLNLRSSRWGSFKALKERGHTVQRRSHHTVAIYGSSGARSSVPVGPAPAVKIEQTDVAASPQAGDEEEKSHASTTRRIPMLKPIQLFNLAQCSEFVPERSDGLDGDAVPRYLEEWERCRAMVEACFVTWAKHQKEIELMKSEIPLMLRLATDFATVVANATRLASAG